MKIAIKVVPGSSRDVIAGWLGDVLKVRVRAKPEQGKANAAVEKMLAKALGLPKQSVKITAGKTASRKTVEFEGLTLEQLREKVAVIVG